MTWKIRWKKNIKESMKENIVIFSLLFSLKNNKENKEKREGQKGGGEGKFYRGIYCAHYFYQFCSASSPLGLQSTLLLLKVRKNFIQSSNFFFFLRKNQGNFWKLFFKTIFETWIILNQFFLNLFYYTLNIIFICNILLFSIIYHYF